MIIQQKECVYCTMLVIQCIDSTILLQIYLLLTVNPSEKVSDVEQLTEQVHFNDVLSVSSYIGIAAFFPVRLCIGFSKKTLCSVL